ncbi:hypothetical protein ACFL1A_01985 [Patescibacteria group bacterium]
MNSKKNTTYGLGVLQIHSDIFLYYCDENGSSLKMETSKDGYSFSPYKEGAQIVGEDKLPYDISKVDNFRISFFNRKYFLAFKIWSGEDAYIHGATSGDLVKWRSIGQLSLGEGGVPMGKMIQTAMIVPELSWKRKKVMYYGDNDIRVAVSSNLKIWAQTDEPVLSKRADKFDNGPLKIATTFVSNKGIVVIYYSTSYHDGTASYSVGSAIFDKNNPHKLLHRSNEPLLSNVEGLANKPVYPLGVIHKHNHLISYWDIQDEGIVAVTHSMTRAGKVQKQGVFKLVLEKLKTNPILAPITCHVWESKAVFNPAAVYENGKVHIIYRAVGDNDVSVLGHATSSDGTTIDKRHKKPIYVPRKAWEGAKGSGPGYSGLYTSGSAYGGIEDPRITKVDDKFYMTYVAYDGWGPPRVAMTSISSQDFQDHNWEGWDDPVLISRPGVVDKNACIFPEKINGKYCIFHRIFPNMLIDYVDSLDFDGKTYLKGEHYIAPREGCWDSRKVGVGAPPIKTPKGWLMIYQAVGDQDPSRYKMGAMLLDLNDPTKVLFRSKDPILVPDQHYENEGLKYGVVYPCGAVEKDGKLFVYYGGADMVVCVAQAEMDEFLQGMTHGREAQLHQVRRVK